MSKKAVSAGHICVDITPVITGEKVERLDKVLAPGKLVQTHGVDIHTGGSVSNTGLAMKILGGDVQLMGKIGKDDFGSIVLSILKSYGAEKGLIISEQEATSYTVALAVPGIDRIFLHDSAANDTFTSDDLDMEAVGEAALFHFGYPSLMKKFYENDGEELLRMVQKVKTAGTAFSLDLAAVDPSSDAGKADWKKILERVLPHVDFFVPSVEEICYMLDKERYDAWMERADGRDVTEVLTMDDIKPLADQILQLGVKVLLLKCGAPGMYYRTADAESIRPLCEALELNLTDWAGKEGFEVSYKPERVLSGTGAGDTSIAAFLISTLNGESLHTAVQLAAATGACAVTTYDALSGLRPLPELKERIRNGWEKNTF